MPNIKNEFHPVNLVPPGETLAELLEENEMSQAELCRRIGRPRRTINEIIKGKVAITPETALQLELVFGKPGASYWLSLEANYQENLARIEQEQNLKTWVSWISELPTKELIDRGFIAASSIAVEQVQELLKFFGVVSPEQWREYWEQQLGVAYRKTEVFASEQGHLAAWLRAGEKLSQKIDCPPYDISLFRKNLQVIRKLTRTTPDIYQKSTIKLCAEAGVRVVFLKQFSKGRVHGATFWPTKANPLILLSLRQKYDDQLWFSFFHEAGHILLHSKKEVFIEQNDMDHQEVEFEANEFAGRQLIAPEKLADFVKGLTRTKSGEPFFDKAAILRFAKDLEIAPSIVVGQLIHLYKMPPQYHQNLRTRLKWGENNDIAIDVPAEI